MSTKKNKEAAAVAAPITMTMGAPLHRPVVKLKSDKTTKGKTLAEIAGVPASPAKLRICTTEEADKFLGIPVGAVDKITSATPVQSINDTLVARGSKYGDFIDHAMVTQRIKDAIFYHTRTDGDIVRLKLKPDQIEAIEMIAHKLGRIANGDPDYIDSWHDIAGYATLVEQRLAKDQGVPRA